MIPPRVALSLVAAYAIGFAWYRRDVRPAALALSALAVINIARVDVGLPPRADAALWMLWPGVYAALAWHAWRVVKADLTTAVALGPFALLAALPWAPVAWTQHPHAWATLLRAPHAFAPLVAVAAWASQKRNGPGIAVHRRASPGPMTTRSWAVASSVIFPAEEQRKRTTPAPARAIAFVLAFSGFLDVTIGALAEGAAWVRAAPLAWATWIAVGLVLLVSAKRA